MTQVKLWQIVSQTPNAIIFTDSDGNLKALPAGTGQQILVAGPDGAPVWMENTALAEALQAKTDAGTALADAKAFTQAQIAALVDNAPIALDTLNELAVKLNGEDSAINALLLQVDGKAEKTEVQTLVAQATQDAIFSGKSYTDTAIANSEATTLQTANSFTTQQIAEALATATADAGLKADAAKQLAVTESNACTDAAVLSVEQRAATDASQKVEQAKNFAIGESNAYTDNKLNALPDRLFARTTATACFVTSSIGYAPEQFIPMSAFSEVTGAALPPDSQLVPKLIFINGLALSGGWNSRSGNVNDAAVMLVGPQAAHAFDGTDNPIMVLCEFTRDSSIYATPEPSPAPPAPQVG